MPSRIHHPKVRAATGVLLATVLAFGSLPGCAQREKPAENAFVSEVQPAKKPFFVFGWLAPLGKIFPKKKRPPAAIPPQWAGTIRMVNAAENFVLVESTGASTLTPGENYLSVTDGHETATLLMTGLRNPPFQIADIVSGTPAAGEKIYLPRGSAPADPQPPAPTPTPAPTQPAPADPTATPETVVRVRTSVSDPTPSPTPKKRSAAPPQRQR